MEQTSQPKWEGKVSATVTKANADQIWPLVKDFFNFHKWFPTLATCYGIHGNNGEPGCIRYCAGSSISSVGDHSDQDRPVSWSKERLLAVDESQRSLSYEIVESNIGFKSYVSTVRIVPGEESGCVIEWSFTVDPVEGWELDDLVKIYEAGLHRMAKKMEDAHALEEKKTKWEGKARAEIKTLKPGQVWSCLEEFCNLHKWHPNIDTCYRVDGVPGQPGLIRYCASTQPSSGSEAIRWVKERLLTLDPAGRCLSYDVVDNNMGFGSYVATMRVEAVDGDDKIGCVMEMSFVADPIGGWRLEDLVSMIDGVLQSMAKNIERAILDPV